jgi:hypothetical protein
MSTEVFHDAFDVRDILYRRTEEGNEAFPRILAYQSQPVVELHGLPDEGIFSDLTTDLFHVIV